MTRWLICCGLAVLAGVALTACESTQDKARKVQAAGAAAVASQRGISVKKENPAVKVLSSDVLSDQNGAAVVVQIESTSKKPLVNLPILIDVRDAKGKSIFKNDTPGLDVSLTHIPLLLPGQKFDWVNDQINILGGGKPASVKAKVGTSTDIAPGQLPKIEVGAAKVGSDVSGANATGSITNKSQIDQKRLVVFGVARQGGKIVAAGRAIVKSLKSGAKPFQFNIFFIGNPKGARVTATAPPTVLK